MNENPYLNLARYILPQELEDHFTLNGVSEEIVGAEHLLHVHLCENDEAPDSRTYLVPNGYYEEMRINDLPACDRHAVLHIRRRQRRDEDGQTVSNKLHCPAAQCLGIIFER